MCEWDWDANGRQTALIAETLVLLDCEELHRVR